MDNIKTELSSFGLDVTNIIPDGNIHRCHTAAKRKKNLDGWYVCRDFKNSFWCIYGCWIRGEQGKCSTLNGTGTVNHEAWEKLEEQRQIEAIIREKEGRIRAEKYIAESIDIDQPHAYLDKKQISTCGTLRNGNLIVIPLYNKDGIISSYQTISETGRKQFMPGGIVGGCCYPIPGNEKVVCICEGFATGASINAATGHKVLVALNAGNIVKVAKSAKERFPNSEILLCCDNDHSKEKNVGLETGKKVAKDLGLAYVYPTGIKGSDFNDMAIEKSIDIVAQSINQRLAINMVTIDDVNSCSRTLYIPKEAIPAGLIREGVEASGQDIIQYTLPLILTVISRAIAGKICFAGHHPNIYNIKVGGTSTGKSETDKLFKTHMNIEKFFGLTDMASGPGLLRSISENPCGLGLFDEVSSLFQHYGQSDPVRDGKINMLLELYSASGGYIKRVYGDSRNSIEINNPCFSLIGNATPTIFDTIKTEDFETGLMQRFNFWMYEGLIPPKKIFHKPDDILKIEAFIQRLNDIVMSKPPQSELANAMGISFPLSASKDALILLQEYSDSIIEAANNESDEGKKGIISRQYELCIKYAMGHHASVGDLYIDMTSADFQFGILIAGLLSDWKLTILDKQVVSGEFHKSCEVFKQAIVASMKAGRGNPTFAYMTSRRTILKNWDQKYSKEVIEVLKKRKEVVTQEIDGITRYYLVKI